MPSQPDPGCAWVLRWVDGSRLFGPRDQFGIGTNTSARRSRTVERLGRSRDGHQRRQRGHQSNSLDEVLGRRSGRRRYQRRSCNSRGEGLPCKNCPGLCLKRMGGSRQSSENDFAVPLQLTETRFEASICASRQTTTRRCSSQGTLPIAPASAARCQRPRSTIRRERPAPAGTTTGRSHPTARD